MNSIADLRALSPGASEYLTVLGYDSPGDGGGGGFFWDSSFNVDLDILPQGEDGGLVIRPNSLQPTQPGRWRRIFDAALSVKWFGAKGNGRTIHDGAMNAGSTQLCSQGGVFTLSDIGKSVSVDGAGAVQDLCTTITRINATDITLATAASTSVIGASVTCVSSTDGPFSGGKMAAGSPLLTIQSGTFTPSDIGRVIRVAGAGSPGPLYSVIGSFINSTQVNLQTAATTKVSMATVFWGTDDTDAIQATEDVASLFKSNVLFPPGTYTINGAKNTVPLDTHELVTRKYGVEKKCHTKWLGYGCASSILRLKSNSTGADPADPQKPVDPQMIYSNAKLNDIGFYRLGFDLNGANNTLCAPANVAAIWFNGNNLEVNGMVVESCKFYHGPGATVMAVANESTSWSGYPLDDVLLQNNRFEDNCLSPVTGDHSTVNIWARRTRVIGNIFRQTAAVPTIQRYTGAIMEFHGADGLFMGNIIDSYGRVVIASENYIAPWTNLLVANNIASDLGLWFINTAVEKSQSPLSRPIDKIVVRGNQVTFNADTSQGGLKAGLLQSHKLPICYIEVSDNYFEMLTPSSGIVSVGVTSQQVSPGTSYTEHLKVSGNTFNKMEFGAWVDNSGFLDQVNNLEFVNNTCLNMQDLGASPEAAGLWVDGSAAQHVENLAVTGNRFINETNNAGYKYGVSLGLHIDSQFLDGNVFYHLKTKDVLQR